MTTFKNYNDNCLEAKGNDYIGDLPQHNCRGDASPLSPWGFTLMHLTTVYFFHTVPIKHLSMKLLREDVCQVHNYPWIQVYNFPWLSFFFLCPVSNHFRSSTSCSCLSSILVKTKWYSSYSWCKKLKRKNTLYNLTADYTIYWTVVVIFWDAVNHMKRNNPNVPLRSYSIYTPGWKPLL